jgi:flagellar protein FliS
MLQTAAQKYQKVRETTASPGELLLALYDGLFGFLRGARVCMESKQTVRALELISKSRAIISELYIALDYGASPELCSQLASIYDFCLDRLMIASTQRKPEALDEVVRVLTPLREAWKIAVPEAARLQNNVARTG